MLLQEKANIQRICSPSHSKTIIKLIITGDEDMEKSESFIAGGKVKCCRYLGKV